MKLFNENNQNIGSITSGGYSPTLNISIAMAYINRIFLKNPSKEFFDRNQTHLPKKIIK